VPAAVGDVAQLLDVDVDQLAGLVALVGPGPWAHRRAAGAVEVGQPGHPEAGQDLVHRRGVDAEQEPDPRRPPTACDSDLEDPPFPPQGEPAGAVMRTRGPVDHPGLTLLAVPLNPASGGGHADLEAFGGPALAPAVIDDTPGQP
jgi:hypothetical protein